MSLEHWLQFRMNLEDAAEKARSAQAAGQKKSFTPFLRLGASMCAAVVITAAAFALPVYMTGLDPIELAMAPEDEIDDEAAWLQALEARNLAVQPAAGPNDQQMLDACREILAGEHHYVEP